MSRTIVGEAESAITNWAILPSICCAISNKYLALNPISKPNFFDDLNLSKYLEKDFRQNILNEKKLNDVMSQVKPNIVFHMAAQSSVLVSYQKPMKTIYENVIGTLNVLEAIKKCSSVKSAIIVTTDKVYLNLESKNKFKTT